MKHKFKEGDYIVSLTAVLSTIREKGDILLVKAIDDKVLAYYNGKDNYEDKYKTTIALSDFRLATEQEAKAAKIAGHRINILEIYNYLNNYTKEDLLEYDKISKNTNNNSNNTIKKSLQPEDLVKNGIYKYTKLDNKGNKTKDSWVFVFIDYDNININVKYRKYYYTNKYYSINRVFNHYTSKICNNPKFIIEYAEPKEQIDLIEHFNLDYKTNSKNVYLIPGSIYLLNTIMVVFTNETNNMSDYLLEIINYNSINSYNIKNYKPLYTNKYRHYPNIEDNLDYYINDIHKHWHHPNNNWHYSSISVNIKKDINVNTNIKPIQSHKSKFKINIPNTYNVKHIILNQKTNNFNINN